MPTKRELPASVTLKCLCPVYLVVENGHISKVVVDDEDLGLQHAEVVGEQVRNKALAQRVVAAIENSEWPAWEFGW